MTRHLLDVSVLLALVWPRHEGHASAQAWFMSSGHAAWATNPVTQMGLVRLLTNPAISSESLSPMAALNLLSAAIRHPGHQFWPLEQDIPTALQLVGAKIRGYRHWTDALLLSQAIQRRGILVTFEAGVQELGGKELKKHLLLLKRM